MQHQTSDNDFEAEKRLKNRLSQRKHREKEKIAYQNLENEGILLAEEKAKTDLREKSLREEQNETDVKVHQMAVAWECMADAMTKDDFDRAEAIASHICLESTATLQWI